MKNSAEQFETIGAAIPEILLPKKGTDIKKWAMIACDQFTQDESYWAEAKKVAGEGCKTQASYCFYAE